MLARFEIIGRLTKDPEVKQTPVGGAVAIISIASNRKYKDKEVVSFFKVVVFGKLAENCSTYLGKGSLIQVEGNMEEKRWKDSDEKSRSTVEFRGESVLFLSSKKDKSADFQKEDDDIAI